MNKNEKMKLDVMDGIDEDIIEKKTEERYMLLQRAKSKPSRKMIITVTSAAASFFVIFGIILAVILLMAKIPVYTGMTVSNTSPITQEEIAANPHDYVKITMTGKSMRVTPVTMLSNGAEISDETSDDTTEETTSSLQIDEETEKTYYAKINEDIYITVHLKNPDNYAILQFTLNGKVYNSYMFEEGSDMENLVLKYNVGDVIGYTEYTIDAIKYVDGTEIKDVRMKGDRTITVGIGAEDPTATVYAVPEFDNSFAVSVKVDISDNYELIKKSNGRAYAVILDANADLEHVSLESVVAKKEVAVGKNARFTFDGLEHRTDYIVAIVAIYDAYDGEGVTLHLLSKTKDPDEPNEEDFEASEGKAVAYVSTNQLIWLEIIRSERGQIAFTLLTSNEDIIVTVTKFELLNAKHQVVAEGDAKTRFFGNVSPYGNYFVRATYTFDKNDGSGPRTETCISNKILVQPWGLEVRGTVADCSRSYDYKDVCAIELPSDGKIYAPFDGVVSFDKKGYYYRVSVSCTIYDDENNPSGDNTYYNISYENVKSIPDGLRSGENVSAGDVIGLGVASECQNGDHIHVVCERLRYEVYYEDFGIQRPDPIGNVLENGFIRVVAPDEE